MFNPIVITQTGNSNNFVSINQNSSQIPPISPMPPMTSMPMMGYVYPGYYYQPFYPYQNNTNLNNNSNNINKVSYKGVNEKFVHSKPMELDTLFRTAKSICKIMVDKGKVYNVGSGFFLKTPYGYYVVTNEHVVNIADKSPIIVETNEKKRHIISQNGRGRASAISPEDFTAIEIYSKDKIFDEVEFLSYDPEYEFGYNQYVGKDIYILQHPQGKSTHAASGKILKITNTIEFNHNADTDYGSSGSPVILFSNNKVIGIHKKRGSGNYNEGTFIGELIEGLSKKY